MIELAPKYYMNIRLKIKEYTHRKINDGTRLKYNKNELKNIFFIIER